MRILPSKKLQHFLIWTAITCVLLGLQKMLYEDVPNELSPKYYSTNSVLITAPPPLLDVPQVIPFHPFAEDQPKMVIILTYQRSGSTFFGRIFNQNPDVFYMFEPIDGFYSAYYGTSMKWNVPSDITSYRNGSQRFLPQEEIDGVSEFLASLLTCDLVDLPAEALLHPYIYYYKTGQYQAASEYLKCIEGYQQIVTQCAARSPRAYCGFRFGEQSEARLRECHRVLHDESFREGHSRRADFEKYFLCMRSFKRIVDEKCLWKLQEKCDERPLRVAKTVRATMDGMESLLRQFPNLRIIHLLRDPRAVVLSRRDFDSSSRGIYSSLDRNNTMPRESKLLCRSVARDVRLRTELERKYPGRIYPIIYDELVHDVKGWTLNIYKFLDYPNPVNTSWFKRTIAPFRAVDSVRRAKKWQNVLTFGQNKDIFRECKDLFELVSTTYWPR